MNAWRIVNVPNAITAFRIPLFFAFWWYAATGQASVAVGIFLFSWTLDFFDGLAARTLHQQTTFGYYFDKVIDRLSAGLGIVLLIRYGLLPDYAILLLVREIGFLPALFPTKSLQQNWHDTGLLGKLATFLEGAGVLWLFFGLPQQILVVSLVAALGSLVAYRHLRYVLIVIIILFASPVHAAGSDVRINEVMWDGIEYVELYNAGADTVSLDGWKLARAQSADSEKEIIVFSGGAQIQGNNYYLIEKKEEATNASSSVVASYLTLLNTGEQVRLYDAGGNLVSTAGEYGAWPAGSNTDTGAAMEWVNGFWVTATATNAGRVGSPGMENGSGGGGGATPTPSITYTTSLVISEALPNPTGDDAVGEFIELYNPSTSEEDISGWQIDDAVGGSTPYTLPSGTVVGSRAYLVVSRSDSGIALNNAGDMARFIDPSGKVWAQVEYSESAADDTSYALTSGGSYVWTTHVTPGAANDIVVPATPTPKPLASSSTKATPTSTPKPLVEEESTTTAVVSPNVVLHSALPNPAGDDATGEYIELINTGNKAIDISGWQLDDEDGGSAPYVIPAGTSIGADQVLRFTREDTNIALNNTNDEVRLLAPNGDVLQSFAYEKVDEDQVLHFDEDQSQGTSGSEDTTDSGQVAGATDEKADTTSAIKDNEPTGSPASAAGDGAASLGTASLTNGGKTYDNQQPDGKSSASKGTGIALGTVLLIGAGSVVVVTAGDMKKLMKAKKVWIKFYKTVKTLKK